MPFYQFDCEPCDIWWDVEGNMSKTPQKRKCPKCNKYRPRVFTPLAGIHFKGAGWETNSHEAKRFREKGMDHSTADEWLTNEIDYSKERMKKSGDHYKKMVISSENLAKNCNVKATPVSDEKAQLKARETCKQRLVTEKLLKKN